ncbi:MAG: oxidoreductase [Deltaproteobacteria bacterium CG11_big_fil_rev_8_21_14_0_20_45_16]|nr:MAG: oxidoreductase [Deltaproteobacteria bacterium CG11_big_fil_rev_8_21_14_0_20_45_16]
MFLKKEFIKGRKVRLGLVGCGRISFKHLEAIKTHEKDCELVAICDSESSRLDAAKVDGPLERYRDYSAMLANPAIDAVVLATPSGLHAEHAIQAARAGKHVITEKPMATRWVDGKRMVQACDEAGVYLFVVKQNRHNPTLQLLKNAVTKRRFGQIYMVNVNVFWSRPQEYYDSASWRGTWEFDGGAMMNQASHYVDLLDWLIGPVQCVQAMTETLARRIEVEDTAVANIKWRSGALGSINVTMLTYKQNMEGSITILGEKGSVRLGGVAVNRVDHWEFADTDPDDAKIKEASYATESVYGHGHAPYYKNVIASLQGVEKPLTDGREGLRSLELLIASYVSARDGRMVSLPLEY